MPQILPQSHVVKFTQKLSLHSFPTKKIRKPPQKYPPKKLGNSLPPKISGSVPKNPKNWMSIQTSIRRNPSKPKKPKTNPDVDDIFQKLIHNSRCTVQKLVEINLTHETHQTFVIKNSTKFLKLFHNPLKFM